MAAPLVGKGSVRYAVRGRLRPPTVRGAGLVVSTDSGVSIIDVGPKGDRVFEAQWHEIDSLWVERNKHLPDRLVVVAGERRAEVDCAKAPDSLRADLVASAPTEVMALRVPEAAAEPKASALTTPEPVVSRSGPPAKRTTTPATRTVASLTKELKAKGVTEIGGKGNALRSLVETLRAGETVVAAINGRLKKEHGLYVFAVATSDRLLLAGNTAGMIFKGLTTFDIPYSDVRAVEVNKRYNADVRIVTDLHTYAIQFVHGPAEEFARAVRDRAAGAGNRTSTDESLASQLDRMVDLHAKGLLTDEEFSAAKARILG
jgi:hypothetical protein